MQFYRFQGELIGTETDRDGREYRRELARKISVGTETFNGTDARKFCFAADVSDNTITLGIITKHVTNLTELIEDYLDVFGWKIKDLNGSEITLHTMESLLSDADRHDYLEDDDDILERFELDLISGRCGRNLPFGENLLDETVQEKEALMKNAGNYFMDETLLPELERIYAGKKCQSAPGHPVHYMVETDNRDTRREVYQILLNALKANLRLDNHRYAFLDFRPGQSYSSMAYEALYKACEGGAVVVRYLADETVGDDDSASGDHETIEDICRLAKLYRNRVLTVICLPRECKKTKSIFYENLGTMSFVEVRENFLNGEQASAILTKLAKEHHVRSDKNLFADFDPEKTYLPTELTDLFNDWYNEKLKQSVYPQYKDMAVARKEAVKAAPKGNAYDELMEMVGLTEAKQVIKKALNYYKMQKLYEEKGVKQDTPAMHMIFSGNPGTAKTTVARLFARIMKDNGLLSKGHLVEVGRGDLVGKYVGWTAQTVQKRFQQAAGGVLFIDEAYSLMDDRDNSFGDEAINTIVQEMENNRAGVVVIFAGYPDKMEGFLGKNPGLRSRIAFHVPFADYDSDELCRIAQMFTQKNGMNLGEGALEKMASVFDRVRTQTDFGNGRYVRNLFEQAKMNQATRLMEKDFDQITSKDVVTITAEDIVLPELPQKTEKRKIGFC